MIMASYVVLLVETLLFCLCVRANNKPCIREQDNRLPYYIQEELPPETLIGNIANDAKLNNKYDQDTINQLRFSFLLRDQSEKIELFSINASTGVLQTALRINRDQLCPNAVTCLVCLQVGVSPAKYFQQINLVVEILDVNDNSPEFHEKVLNKRLSEMAVVGSSFSVPTATDPDSVEFGIQRYELVGYSGNFHLRELVTATGYKDVRIYLDHEMDREVADSYILPVVAYDGGDPPRSGSLMVNITVDDSNDNHPVFERASYEVFVSENSPPGVVIAKVHAVDGDIDENGKIYYSFSPRTEKIYGRLFRIGNESGEIMMKQALDYEKGFVYMLVVTAKDGGPNPRLSRADVTIRVRDENDNSPRITVNTLTTNGEARVSEDADVGSFVAHVSVTDADSGRNGITSCSLDHEKFDMRFLASNQFKIVTTSMLDREMTPAYALTIKCQDEGLPPKNSAEQVIVRVLDENDNPPRFSSTSYAADLPENNLVGEVILVLNATDNDEGLNGQIKYAIAKQHEDLFQVHSVSGTVCAKVIFDRESLRDITFNVIVNDMGKPSLSSTATVTLTILDQNDEFPVFSQDSYTFGVFENEPINTEVGVVSAKDRDGTEYNQFLFAIVTTEADVVNRFTIDSHFGQITTRQVLDREERHVYLLTVIAKTEMFPRRSNTASVTIYIADKNDNTPIIAWPHCDNNTVSISNKLPKGFNIACLQAHDLDIGSNGKLSYEMSSVDKIDMFSIDETTGQISVKNSLESILDHTYRVIVRVRDNGRRRRTATAPLNIIVNQSIPYEHPTEVVLNGNNTAILISLCSVCLILIICITGSIIMMYRRARNTKLPSDRVGPARTESQRMLTVPDENDGRGTCDNTAVQRRKPPTTSLSTRNSWAHSEVTVIDDIGRDEMTDPVVITVYDYLNSKPSRPRSTDINSSFVYLEQKAYRNYIRDKQNEDGVILTIPQINNSRV